MKSRTYRKLSFLFPMFLLGACGGGSGFLGETPTLSGRVEAWSLGTGYTVQAEVTAAVTDPSLRVLGTGTIDEVGQFSITLPGAEVMNKYGNFQSTLISGASDCNGGTLDGSVTVNPNPLQGVKLTLYAVSGSTKRRISQTSTSLTRMNQMSTQTSLGVAYYYSLIQGSASGSATCTAGSISSRISLGVGLNPGWNSVVTDVHTEQLAPSSGTVSSTLYSGSAPVQVQWTLN